MQEGAWNLAFDTQSISESIFSQEKKPQTILLTRFDIPAQQPATEANRFTPATNQSLLFSPSASHSPFCLCFMINMV